MQIIQEKGQKKVCFFLKKEKKKKERRSKETGMNEPADSLLPLNIPEGGECTFGRKAWRRFRI